MVEETIGRSGDLTKVTDWPEVILTPWELVLTLETPRKPESFPREGPAYKHDSFPSQTGAKDRAHILSHLASSRSELVTLMVMPSLYYQDRMGLEKQSRLCQEERGCFDHICTAHSPNMPQEVHMKEQKQIPAWLGYHSLGCVEHQVIHIGTEANSHPWELSKGPADLQRN